MYPNSLKVMGVMLAVLALTACQNVKSLMSKRDNGSLDYTKAQTLPPLKLPTKQATTSFTPLYQIPEISGQPMVEEGAKQYKLPAPPKTVR